MPPDGYESVTLPSGLVQDLETIGAGSAARGVRQLLVDSNPRGDDISEQLDRIEAAAKEATNAAQSAEAAVENMEARR